MAGKLLIYSPYLRISASYEHFPPLYLGPIHRTDGHHWGGESLVDGASALSIRGMRSLPV